MIGNVIDRRTDHRCPECDVVFEPSTHDNAEGPDGAERFPVEEATGDTAYFFAKEMIDTTVREALLHAEKSWTFAVTVFLYDKGTRPLSG